MGELIGIDGKPRDGLVERLRASFVADGSAQADIEDLDVTVTAWRAAARKAARQLGRPVETLAGQAQVWAVLKDWPADDRERDAHRARLRAAVDAIPALPSQQRHTTTKLRAATEPVAPQ
jgi:hypothetical protein